MKTTLTTILFFVSCSLLCIALFSCGGQTQTFKCPGFEASKRNYLINKSGDRIQFASANGDKAVLSFGQLFETKPSEETCERGTFSSSYCDGCDQPYATLTGAISINAGTDSVMTINNFRVTVSQPNSASGSSTGLVYVGVNPIINMEGFTYQVEPNFSLITERTQAAFVPSITLNNKTFSQVILSKMDSSFFNRSSNIDSVYFSTQAGLVGFSTRTPRKLFVRE